jgi:predicted ArsR family transcriptional regulator
MINEQSKKDLVKMALIEKPKRASQISKELSIPKSTVYYSLNRLLSLNEVKRFKYKVSGKRGRPSVFWALVDMDKKYYKRNRYGEHYSR